MRFTHLFYQINILVQLQLSFTWSITERNRSRYTTRSSTLRAPRNHSRVSNECSVPPSPNYFKIGYHRPHPLSSTSTLFYDDPTTVRNNAQFQALELLVHSINTELCGVVINGTQYWLTLTLLEGSYASEKSNDKETMTTSQFDLYFDLLILDQEVSSKHYSHYQSDVCGVLFTNALISSDKEYDDTDDIVVFSTLPDLDQYYRLIMLRYLMIPNYHDYHDTEDNVEVVGEALQYTHKVAWIYDDTDTYAQELCTPFNSIANDDDIMNMMFPVSILHNTTTDTHTFAALEEIVRELQKEEVTHVVVCLHRAWCTEWNRVLYELDWFPLDGVQLFAPICDSIRDGSVSAEFLNQYSVIIPRTEPLSMSDLQNSKDKLLGWTTNNFLQRCTQFISNDLYGLYEADGGFYDYDSILSVVSALSVTLQAAMLANSSQASFITQVLQSETNPYQTLLGNMTFDEHGYRRINLSNSSLLPNLNNRDIIPSWKERGCIYFSDCETSQEGECLTDGSCLCSSPYQLATGLGENATCITNNPDLSLLSTDIHYVGKCYLAMQTLLSIGAIAWTIYNRHTDLVRLNQPVFLLMIAVGCLIMACSIIPMGVEDVDENGERLPIEFVNAACSSVQWIYGIGFIIVYAALLAKIRRVLKLVHFGPGIQRKQLKTKDMLPLIFSLVFSEIILLIISQIIAPMEWKRSDVIIDISGDVIVSKGYCFSNPNVDLGLMSKLDIQISTIFHAVCICVALLQSFMAWFRLPNELIEGIMIIASILTFCQSLIIGAPTLYLALKDGATETLYFAKITLCFLQSSTIICFMFLPKVVRLLCMGDVNVSTVVAETISYASNRASLSRTRPSFGALRREKKKDLERYDECSFESASNN